MSKSRLDSSGDTVLCVRMNVLDDFKLADTVQTADAMRACYDDAQLTPRRLVVGRASGAVSHCSRPDLALIEAHAMAGDVRCVVWRDADTVSRSGRCVVEHHRMLAAAYAELHLLRLRRAVDFVVDEMLLSMLPPSGVDEWH